MNLSQIKEQLNQAHSFLIFSHQNPDGDAIGSAVAMGLTLKAMGKTVGYCMQKDTKGCAELLEEPCHFDDPIQQSYDMAIVLDCSSMNYIFHKSCLERCVEIMVIDHHVTNERYGTYNYIDATAAAVGEIIYLLAKEIDVLITHEIAHAVYIAIVEDTGNFSYSNVTSRTHRVAADLYELYHDFHYYTEQLQLYPMQKLLLMREFLDHVTSYHANRMMVGVVSYDFLKDNDGDTEGLTDLIRNVKECMLAVFIKEAEPNIYKVSMRSRDDDINVAAISKDFDGGGHKRAAGFRYCGNLADLITYFETLADRIWTDTF